MRAHARGHTHIHTHNADGDSRDHKRTQKVFYSFFLFLFCVLVNVLISSLWQLTDKSQEISSVRFYLNSKDLDRITNMANSESLPIFFQIISEPGQLQKL